MWRGKAFDVHAFWVFFFPLTVCLVGLGSVMSGRVKNVNPRAQKTWWGPPRSNASSSSVYYTLWVDFSTLFHLIKVFSYFYHLFLKILLGTYIKTKLLLHF